MTETNHLITVRDLLLAASDVDLPDGDIYAGPNDSTTDGRVIVMQPSGSDESPQGFFNNQAETVRAENVQIECRAKFFHKSYDDARAVKNSLIQRTPSGYVKVHAFNGPLFGGFDDRNRVIHTVNVTCQIVE